MSIRLRLILLVSVLLLMAATVIVYVASAYFDTRQRLRESNAVLDELVQASNTGALIGDLRLTVLYEAHDSDAPSARARQCQEAFKAWADSSRRSTQAGTVGEQEDLKAILALAESFEEEWNGLQALLEEGKPAREDIFDRLVDTGVREIITDDLGEMNAAMDGLLLSMGTTPWIARIGPGQLATARATLTEIRSVQLVRDRLQRQSSHIALLLAQPNPENERAVVRTTVSLDESLRAWERATIAYARVSGEEAPPWHGEFTEVNDRLQQHVGHLLDAIATGRVEEARALAESRWMPALRGDLLPTLERSLTAEVEELRGMLQEISASTGFAGLGGIALTCLVFFSALAIALQTVRGMLHALGRLQRGTEAVGAGDFDHRVGLSTSDELGRLGARFDAMAERLQEQEQLRGRLEEELLRAERLATLGQVIATVSHEIRNPLGTIQTAVHTLRVRTSDDGGPVDRSLDRADRSIQRCNRIIQELLDYTRAQPPALEKTAIDPWVDSVLDDYQLPVGVQLSREIDARATVMIDRSRLQGCLVNLLTNACQSILEEKDNPRHICVRTARRADRIEITVSDTGAGIPPDVQTKIFEPMFSTRTFGVGLGLPIVKKYMEQHGGGVTISSEDGCGAIATLWLPKLAEEPDIDKEAQDTRGR